jgi:phospholipid transport system substrate-binding protein
LGTRIDNKGGPAASPQGAIQENRRNIVERSIQAAGSIWRRLAAGMFLVAAGLVTVAARADNQPPDQLVKSLSNQVIDSIKADKSLQTGDPNKLQGLIDAKVMPSVDFEKMTQLAVGRGWRTATPDQKTQLEKQFRTLLVRTYSGAMSQVRDQHVELKPFRGDANSNDVIVQSQIVGGQGDPIQLDYHLEKAQDGSWKIYDVNVLGVWLVETYRTQFRQQVDQGGIDGLIKSLQARNEQNAK